MGSRYWLFAPLFLFAAAAAQAQPPAALPDVPALCGPTVAFGESFGSTKIAGRAQHGFGYFAFGPMRPADRPFDQIEIGFGARSGTIFKVTASITAANATESEAMAEAIREQFRRAGWIEASDANGREQLFDPLDDGDPQFNSEPDGLLARPRGRRVDIFTLGRLVNVSCTDLPAFVDHVEAAFGQPMVRGERPRMETTLPAEVPPPLDCSRPPVELKAKLAGPIERPGRWPEAAGAANRYFEQVIAWNGQRMIDSGAWTEEQESEFALALLGRPELAEGWAYYGELTNVVLDHLIAVTDRFNTRDYAGACTAYNGLFAELSDAPQRTVAFAEAVDRIYAAEAERLGISFE